MNAPKWFYVVSAGCIVALAGAESYKILRSARSEPDRIRRWEYHNGEIFDPVSGIACGEDGPPSKWSCVDMKTGRVVSITGDMPTAMDKLRALAEGRTGDSIARTPDALDRLLAERRSSAQEKH